MDINFKNLNSDTVKILVSSIIISALVGSVFGYYGAYLNRSSASITNIIKRENNESSSVVELVKNVSPSVAVH